MSVALPGSPTVWTAAAGDATADAPLAVAQAVLLAARSGSILATPPGALDGSGASRSERALPARRCSTTAAADHPYAPPPSPSLFSRSVALRADAPHDDAHGPARRRPGARGRRRGRALLRRVLPRHVLRRAAVSLRQPRSCVAAVAAAALLCCRRVPSASPPHPPPPPHPVPASLPRRARAQSRRSAARWTTWYTRWTPRRRC